MPDSIRPKNRVVFFYMLMPMLLFIFSVFFPLVTAGVYSFFEWKGGPNKTFIGIENYVALIKDNIFWNAFGHNIYLVIVCIIGQIGLAFVFSLMIQSRLLKFKGIHRTFGFFPSTISAVAIGFIWKMIYDYKRGILNWFLIAIGKEDLTSVWLDDPKKVMLLVAIPLIWQYIGYYMIIILSAMASVDKEIYEVAEIDGANGIQRAIYIVFPLIKSTLLVCLTLCIAGNMKAFDNIYVMTMGGPGNASNVMAMYGYNVSFKQSNMGYGSAISIGIFVLSMAVIGGSQWLIKWLTTSKERI
jgi:raffinose/stachyose/melibiose transport system permease protein